LPCRAAGYLVEPQQHLESRVLGQAGGQIGEGVRVSEDQLDRMLGSSDFVRRTRPPGEYQTRPVGPDLAGVLARQVLVELVPDRAGRQIDAREQGAVGDSGALAKVQLLRRAELQGLEVALTRADQHDPRPVRSKCG